MGYVILFVQLSTILLSVYYFWVYLKSRQDRYRRLPPGPKPLPIIGNLLDIPRETEDEFMWKSWAKHKDLYGPISSVVVFGTVLIMINDADVAFELLEGRSSIYCDRPRLNFGGKMCGYENILGMSYYHEHFKVYRKNIFQFIGTKNALSHYYPLLDSHTRRVMRVWLDKPDQIAQELRKSAGATILEMAYGYTAASSGKDPLLEEADEALENFSIACQAGRWLVDTLPFLEYVPEWVPGASFKKTARSMRQALINVVERPFSFVKRQVNNQQHVQSYASKVLENVVTEEDEFIAKWSAVSLYIGGVDTTASSLYGFYLAMILYPSVQKRAQEEIDAFVGPDCLPSIDDRDSLPYVNALIKELLRWNTIAPLAIPHSSLEDDVYKGYYIPKGSVLVPNVWQFHNDPKNYHDSETFKPERFLEVNGKFPEPDPRNTMFGFGRRACPGRELAEASMFLTIAMTLAVFDISKARDDNGNEITPSVERTKTLLSVLKDFPCNLKVRSVTAEALIRAIDEEHNLKEDDSMKV